VTRPGQALTLGAVVLVGGTAARMGGVDKAALEVEGVTLLERVLAAVMSAAEVVVVGDRVPTSRTVTWTVEDPPLGGPAAGLLAGLDTFATAPALVAVLAVDMPKVNAGTVARLTWAVEADPGVDGAVLVDPAGRRQTLAAVYRFAALSAARPPRHEQHGLPMRRLVAGLRLAEVAPVGDEARDVDTWDDLRDLTR
jgi:molybdopterin-guanine dinucleotide biosynthesis protein A